MYVYNLRHEHLGAWYGIFGWHEIVHVYKNIWPSVQITCLCTMQTICICIIKVRIRFLLVRKSQVNWMIQASMRIFLKYYLPSGLICLLFIYPSILILSRYLIRYLLTVVSIQLPWWPWEEFARRGLSACYLMIFIYFCFVARYVWISTSLVIIKMSVQASVTWMIYYYNISINILFYF